MPTDVVPQCHISTILKHLPVPVPPCPLPFVLAFPMHSSSLTQRYPLAWTFPAQCAVVTTTTAPDPTGNPPHNTVAQ